MAEYRITKEAKADLIQIYKFGIETFGEKQADKYLNGLFKCFETIARNPFAFESVDFIKKGYRRCPFESNSIFYRIEKQGIEIIAIIGKQNLDTLLK